MEKNNESNSTAFTTVGKGEVLILNEKEKENL